MPTSKAMSTSTSAMVVALDTTAADTVAMNPRVASISMIAMAITYPRMGRTVSSKPNFIAPSDYTNSNTIEKYLRLLMLFLNRDNI
jgi:hypothetical protein